MVADGFWGFPEYASTCADDDYDRAGSILHEMTHLYGTDDYVRESLSAAIAVMYANVHLGLWSDRGEAALGYAG